MYGPVSSTFFPREGIFDFPERGYLTVQRESLSFCVGSSSPGLATYSTSCCRIRHFLDFRQGKVTKWVFELQNGCMVQTHSNLLIPLTLNGLCMHGIILADTIDDYVSRVP